MRAGVSSLCGTIVACLVLSGLAAGQGKPADNLAAIVELRMSTLRDLSPDERPAATRQLALAIRALPSAESRISLASSLANLSTEGDNGRETLQEVTNTLVEAIHQAPADSDRVAGAYAALARLARYEGVTVNLDDPLYLAALGKLAREDEQRRTATFSLTDLSDKQWSLDGLRGKVVLVNFWATWCPPCRKEMPDLDALYKRFRDKGFVVLAISDEEEVVVRRFLAEHPYSFPVLLDPGKHAGQAYLVEGIPKSFVYDREGNLVATAVDQRTQRQFLEMLVRAGLE